MPQVQSRINPEKIRFVNRESLIEFTANHMKTRIFSDSPVTAKCLEDLCSFLGSFSESVDLIFFHNWMADYIYESILTGSEDVQVMQISAEKAVLADFFSDLDFSVYEQWGV